MKITENITITNEDNMELMKRYPDNYFDLAIVDPPYGLGMHKAQGNTKEKQKKWIGGEWDNKTPNKSYWYELKRVSKNQIVWGANYFIEHLSSGNKWIVWDKMLDKDQSHFEIAWSSFIGAERIYRSSRSKLQGFMNPNRFHPTEKPINLYSFLLKEFAKQNDKILDTHLGSGSIAIACHDYGYELTACELDKEYYDKAIERIKNHTNQTKLF
jgi:site-specific DNA-methyltransferase (adenine-specific)